MYMSSQTLHIGLVGWFCLTSHRQQGHLGPHKEKAYWVVRPHTLTIT